MFGLILIFFVACEEDKMEDGFSASGENSISQGSFGENSTENSDNDGEEEIEENDGASPEITGTSAFFNSDPTYGDIIELHVNYDDPQDDVEEGKLYIDYSSSEESNSITADIDGQDALLETGEVFVYFQGVNDTLEYTFSIILEDSSGNQSDQATAVASPVE